MAECLQISAERGEDTAVMARLESARGQGRRHDVMVLGTSVAISDTARDLGVVIDRELSLAAHVTAVCRSSYASSDQ